MANTKLPANDTYIGAVKVFNAAGTLVTALSLEDDAVTTAKILNDAVTTAKILEKNVTTAQLADDIQVGSLATLTTTANTSVTAAINEVDANADSAIATAATHTTAIGTLASLTTTEKTNLVGAINEIDAANAGMVTLTGTQTLTNKTLTTPVLSDGDAGLSITSANQTSGTATATFPDIGDAADTVVMADTSQTLTNKTLTSATLTTPKIVTTGSINDAGGDEYLRFVEAATPITYVQITSGNTTVDPIVQGAGETNIGLQLMGSGTGNVKIVDATTPSKALDFELVGATSSTKTTITASQTGDRVITLPDATDTLVGKATTDTLTNKTLTSPVLTTPQINDTSADHQYVFAVSELTADRTVTLPLLTGGDEFVFKDHTQTLTNKTLTSPVLTTPQINDTSSDHQYIFAGSELTADRTVTLPLLTAGDEFVFKAHTQTLTNKTLTAPTLTSAVITGATVSSLVLSDGHENLDITVTNQTDSGATLTIPDMVDSADEMVLKDLAQTLTNKTLTAPAIAGGVLSGTFTGTYTQTVTSATVGNVEPFVMSSTLTGPGATGGRARFQLDTNVALGGWANALKAQTVFGASGRVSGLGSALCAELTLSAGCTPGTYAPIEIELNMGAAGVTGAQTALIWASVNDAKASVFDDYGYIMSLNGLTIDTGHVFQASAKAAINSTHAIRISVLGVDYFIPCHTSAAFGV